MGSTEEKTIEEIYTIISFKTKEEMGIYDSRNKSWREERAQEREQEMETDATKPSGERIIRNGWIKLLYATAFLMYKSLGWLWVWVSTSNNQLYQFFLWPTLQYHAAYTIKSFLK